MLSKLQKRNSEGFTIIEVMIVLAIAALILLIVLLAVPALQRNSRNTQRKNDVSAIVSGTTESVNNNNGGMPTSVTGNNPVVITGANGANNNASVGFYNSGSSQQAGCPTAGTAGHVYLDTGLTAGSCAAFATVDSAHDYAAIIVNGSCAPGGGGVVNYTARAIAVQYEIETSGGTGYTMQCQGS